MASFSTASPARFTVGVHQNEHLPEGGREVDAIVTVTATADATATPAPYPFRAASGPGAAVVIMVDCSGSMAHPPGKMRAAREATAAAIDTLRDGVRFAVVAGTHRATQAYPGGGALAVADARTRAEAGQAVHRLAPGGGTAIGTWLRLADQLLHSADVSIRHGILLTDGRDENESPADLRAALDACSGRFTCDVRGVGTDWEVKEVTGIASALLGSADIVADPAELVDDFTRLMRRATGKEVADVALRLWTPVGAEIVFVRQVAPVVEDLTDRRAPAGTRVGDYPTGSWGDESREYHIRLRVPAAELGQEMLAARVSVVAPESDGSPRPLAQGLVRATWTDDTAAVAAFHPRVAHYTGQAELAAAIQEGLDARRAGDDDGARAKLGRAVQLAGALGNETTGRLLARVVEVVDAATGTVRLRPGVEAADEMTLETRSTRTVHVVRPPGARGHEVVAGAHGLPLDGAPAPGDTGAAADGAQPRFLEAELVEQAPPGREVPLHVRVTRQASTGPAVALRGFPVPAGGARLLVTVHAPGLLALGDLQQELVVPPDQDSPWLQFGLRTMTPGLHTVTVRAFHKGTFLGELRAQVSVQPGTPARDGPPRTAPLTTLAFDPGEVTLQVLKGADGAYSFQLLGETTYAPESFRLLAGDSHAARERIYDELRHLAAAAGPGAEQRRARRRLVNLGVQLWATAVPDAVRQQFWAEAGRVTALTVIGEHDAVPWELLYPLDGEREGDGFLAEWLPVVRRVFGQDRVRELSLASAAFVVPPGSPPEAEREVLALRARLGSSVADGGTLTRRAAVSDLIDEGLDGLLHFACHNAFTAAGSRVTMADGPFDPIDLAYATHSGALRTTHPLVFFNACRSAGEIDWFSTSLGWAPQFLRAGAGAFIGTLWPVRSDTALLFADTFYEHLVGRGQNLGQASLSARRAIRDHGGDPTWLAYAVYGSPAACATTPEGLCRTP
jgi:hypothetical protein